MTNYSKDVKTKLSYEFYFNDMMNELNELLNLTRKNRIIISEKPKNKTSHFIANNIRAIKSSSKGTTIIKNPGKSLSPDSRGYIPKNIENIIDNYLDREDYKFYRYGTTNYPINSFLHCVCYATDNEDYMILESDEERDNYVNELRLYIIKNINLSVLRQELFDYTDEEIIQLFNDPNKFFDPFLLYRAVEEIFGVNIYVFTYDEDKGLEVPRHKIFHTRPIRSYRPTILIMKIIARGKDADNIPKCELIVDYNDDKFEIVKIFGNSMNTICHNLILQNYSSIFTISYDNDAYYSRKNMYNYLDHNNIFNNNLVSQIIDENGKMQGFVAYINNEFITVVTPPSQPENLPLTKDIKLSTLNNVLNIFGDPSGITMDDDDKITGLWYKILDVTYGEYIPIVPVINTLLNIPIGPNNPLGYIGKSDTSRLRKLKRTVNIISELIKWCYSLSKTIRTTPYIFQQKYFEISTVKIKDSAEFYDLSKIERRLPDISMVRSTIEAINYMSNIAPTLFKNGKIIMYSKDFSNKIKDMLINYDNEFIYPEIAVMKVIDNFYETSDDFIFAPNTKLFLSRNELDSWLLSLRHTQNYIQKLNTTIDLPKSVTIEPFVFQTDKNVIYLIQNTSDFTPDRALTISNLWNKEQINYGANTKPLSPSSYLRYPHYVYAISSNSQLIVIEDNTNGYNEPGEYLEILYYGSQNEYNNEVLAKYAALLRLV